MTLGFADPRGWWLVAALAAFVLLLTRKLRHRSVALSTYFILKRLARDLEVLHRRFRLLRRVIFMLFMGAAAATALAGLAPFSAGSRRPLKEMAIVDLSPSLGVLEQGRPRMEALRREVGGYLRDLEGDDTLWLVTASPSPSVSRLSVGRRIRGLAAGLDWTDAAADLDGAAAMASEISSREGLDHVLVFTDRPARWTGPLRDHPLNGPEPRFVTVGRPAENAGITAFDLRPQGRGGGHALFVRFMNASVRGGEGEPIFTLEVLNNGRSLASVRRPCPPGSQAEAVFEALALEAGRVEVRLSPGGGYPADDRAVAGVGGETRARVYLVTAGNRFLEKALAADESVELARVGPGQPVPEDPGAVYVLDGIVPEGPVPGRAVMMLPNRHMEGLRFRAFLPAGERVDWEREEPVLRGVDLGSLSPRGYLEIEESPDFLPIVTLDGRPLVLLSRGQSRRWAVLGFDPSQTGFVYEPSYPILVTNLVRWASLLADAEGSYLRAGQPVALPAEAAGGEVRLPSGRKVPLPRAEGGVVFERSEHPGAYRVRSREGKDLGEFFLNVADSRVTAEIASAGYGHGGGGVPEGLGRGFGLVDLTPWLAALAVLMLVGEAVLARRQASGKE